ncbi:GNAT family N-acetyltransferase [Prauserella rugosa]|uniref:Acetyltransferase (GNAT) family protein n=1 Tax=Prauserella rugosa TaxID=43354 RepID=A0A660CHK0_9PSEU|nr:GNAT family N-acetyltransferase [Prauserella rugosa]KID31054.1 acetyltransferase (GNAT) family protein [Prauserella sp. Am3]KMS91031.1 acetyltransferase [Streptomyces regensis]TWH22836.1 acetyltransferase (GNAT) family protein [Prauserella rugosa]
MDIRTLPFDHPDSAKLIDLVQQEYVTRYGDPDVTPVDPAEFAAPQGIFLVGYRDEVPVACGGWRSHDEDDGSLRAGDAEIKRMFVVDGERGKGYARTMLAALERTASDAGCHRIVLETGLKQPEAIALYRSSGYHEIDKFGVYAQDELSVCMAKELE